MAVEVVTFGCRLNTLESEAIRSAAAGLDDTIVVNTCAVTAEAVRQARQTIRRLARERPDAKIVVTGCAAQVEPETFQALPQVRRIVGNDVKNSPEFWSELARTRGESAPEDFGLATEEKIRVNDIFAARETALPFVEGIEGRARAFVQVQNGCDHRCTFCIIPYGRGNSRSVPMGEVVAQVRRLTDNGYREVVLTGVDITSYGGGLPGAPRLGKLVKQILKHVPELPRLRLSSIDSVEADADLLDALGNEPRLMPHLHLSLQHGDDIILKRMKRRHSRADAVAFAAQVRRLRPDIVFGADIIAGFPTETEDMFARCLDLVEDCGLTHLHVFPYSERRGTPAARMPQVPVPVRRERAARLRERGTAMLARHLDGEIGARRRVLAESHDVGRTEQFTPVRLGRTSEPGSMLDVTVAGHDGRQLIAA
jgi:threonylcarbamoyladenosine tRNA methylthiotransferase MtaB